ncbi:VOC family protein [Phenylobacterium sp. J426]|uniref:VOC family protein n=1 Tax=Phenylobacterium sp. J426 TaxID=2898439 RepID=UPI002150D51D|nr:VOC family protein [Phenylobacterium sp. J426]MCR5872727.1 VOC family protein [Phenylobacterium sp. J426]
MAKPNTEFEIRGVNHLALVCKDMAETVKFYRDILGMPLTKTIDLPRDLGQHFFFDIGNGDSLAFFWFKDAPPAQPGHASPSALPTQGSFVSAHGSMNHIAFDVPAEKFDAYVQKLKDKGIAVSQILNHDNSETGSSAEVTDDVFVRSVYFFDPDGVCLEFASWVGKPFDDDDVAHAPMKADGVRDESVITPLAKRRKLQPAE